MEDLELQELTNGYRERMRRLALFDPLHELERKREADLDGQLIDLKGLGLLSLLFFFEQKVMRHYRTGVADLSLFLMKLLQPRHRVQQEMCEKLARQIVQTFRPASGKKRSYPFFNWETMKEETIEYSILKANTFEAKTNTQYYTLDEDGLELLFATKEFYSEFQLSINQLMLRKQLEKGEFRGALRQINEMRIDVETLDERMIKLKHEIQRSIVSEETFERYKSLLEDIYGRLAREDEEFKELRQFVKETRDRLAMKDVQQKENRSYHYVLKINSELESVHYEHSRLLGQTLTLKNTTLLTAQESLYYTGMQSFNFDHDLVSHIVSTPLPLDSMQGILQPFMKIEENPSWSLLTVFAEQNINEERKEKEEQGMVEADESEEMNPYRLRISALYKEVMALLLEAFESQRVSTLSDFITYLEAHEESERLQMRYFYEFWIILHQRSPIVNGEIKNTEETDGKTVFDEAIHLLEGRKLTVQEEKSVITRFERFSIQEMSIELEEAKDELFGG